MEVKVINHSIAKHYLTILRDKTTNPDEFRKATNKLSGLLITEATREINLNEKKIDTPLAPYIGSEVSVGSVAVPVLRAGLGLLEGVQNILPNLSVGYIGVQRNEETSHPEDYFSKLPDVSGKNIFVLEPMLATGGSLTSRPFQGASVLLGSSWIRYDSGARGVAVFSRCSSIETAKA